MFYKVIGLLFVGLAVMGVVLPVLPTTPFLLVAAGCFAKSSPRLYQKLITNPIFGPLINDWQTSRSIPKRGKIAALLSMFFAALWSCYILDLTVYKTLVILAMIGPALFIWTLPVTTKKSDKKPI